MSWFAAPKHRVLAVGLDQLLEALHAEPGRGDLRLEVADELAGSAGVVADELPQRLVAHALAVELSAVEQHAFGEDVGDVDDQAGRRRADVDVVRGVGREADQSPL